MLYSVETPAMATDECWKKESSIFFMVVSLASLEWRSKLRLESLGQSMTGQPERRLRRGKMGCWLIDSWRACSIQYPII